MKISAVIEKDIKQRSQAALNGQNMVWANLIVDGRDITLRGTAPSEAAKKAAGQAVQIDGYHIIHNQLALNATMSGSNQTKNKPSTTKEETKKVIAKQAKDCQNKFNRLLKKGIYFKSSSAIIQKTSFSVLNKMASTAKECHHFNLQIHGHTDSSGQNLLNKKLSHGRANAVMEYLISKAINDKRLTALGHGSSTPVANNRTKRGRAKNRRIEITVEEKQ
jgi:outer membrane protein OmpA-like peptidoglycan-associated protein